MDTMSTAVAEAATPDAEAPQPPPTLQEQARQDALRAEVKRLQAVRRCAMADIAKEVGIPNGTFSQWVAGTYAGRNERIGEAVRKWLGSVEAAAQSRAVLPDAPGFLMTPGAEMFFAAFEHAQHAPDIAVVSGGAGVGKTSSIVAYRAKASNVWVLTGEPCITTPRMLLDELADLLGVSEGRSAHRTSRAIADRLRGTRGLLVVDEAQHLGTTTLDQVRTLHDLAGVGVALVGNEAVASRIEGSRRRAEFAQLFSRVGIRVSRARPAAGDVKALLDAWGVHGAAERRLAGAIARNPGGLRVMTKVLRMAAMQANAAQEAGIPARMIEMAWEQIAARPLVEVAA